MKYRAPGIGFPKDLPYISPMKKIGITPLLTLLFLATSTLAQDVTTLYNEGLKLRQEKKYKEAVEKFSKATLANPNHFDSQYEMGWCLNELKSYSDAIIALRKARNLNPGMAKVHFELGYAFQQSSNPDSANKCYDRCLSINPKYSLAFKQKGYISYLKDDFNQALDFFKGYESVASQEINDYLYWYRKGYSFNAIDNYDSAKVALNRSLRFKKDYINTYWELGFATTKLKEADEAIGYFNQAISLDPNSHIAYNGIGEVYRDLKKDRPTAILWYEKTLAINATERKANFGKGYCLNSLGKYTEAVPYLQTAIKSESTYTAAYVDLGYSYYMLNRYEEGLTQLRKAIELNANNQNARYYSGLIYIAQKNKTMAQKMVDELTQLKSGSAKTLQDKVNAMN